jgi:trehalose 6-phosphate phosphatase
MNNELLRQILGQGPCGLLTDIDGTISPIAATPAESRVSSAARESLRLLAQRLDLVAAISGRAASDAAALVGLPELIYIGNHGLELWRDGLARPLPEAAAYGPAIEDLLRAAQERIALPGVLFENKGLTASVHYRLADAPEQAGVALGEILQALAAERGLILTPGRMVWELRPPLAVNKGTAARWLVEHYHLRSVLFLGDDRTDADAFQALRELRAQGSCAALNIGVAAAETPAIVRELADIMVDGVTGVEALLAGLTGLLAEQNATADRSKDG